MELNSAKLIGKKLFEIVKSQKEEQKTYIFLDEILGGQITLYFNKTSNTFNGNHSGVTEDFSGNIVAGIMNLHKQDGNTITLTKSEII